MYTIIISLMFHWPPLHYNNIIPSTDWFTSNGYHTEILTITITKSILFTLAIQYIVQINMSCSTIMFCSYAFVATCTTTEPIVVCITKIIYPYARWLMRGGGWNRYKDILSLFGCSKYCQSFLFCRDEKLQALHITQLLASRASDLKSSITEISSTIKVDMNDTQLVVTDLSSKWRQYQQAIEKGSLCYCT
jgi:hypothetical protein